MMRLAFGAKCGALGASGFSNAECGARSAESAPNNFSFSKDVSASPPRPTPHWRKKCRRVVARNASPQMNCCLFMRLSSDDVSSADVRTNSARRTAPIHAFRIVSREHFWRNGTHESRAPLPAWIWFRGFVERRRDLLRQYSHFAAQDQ